MFQAAAAASKGDVKKLKKAISLIKNDDNDIDDVVYHSDTFGTPLHFAAAGDHLECVKLLLDEGADYKKKDYNSLTPLELHIK